MPEVDPSLQKLPDAYILSYRTLQNSPFSGGWTSARASQSAVNLDENRRETYPDHHLGLTQVVNTLGVPSGGRA